MGNVHERDSLLARFSREQFVPREDKRNGLAGLFSLALLTVLIGVFGWIDFYGPGLEPHSFIVRNWPPRPELGDHFRLVGWGGFVLGGWVMLWTVIFAGRDGLKIRQLLEYLWVSAVLVGGGLLFHAQAWQYDRWFAIHGEMTQEEIKAAPAWTEPGLPSLDELF